MPVWGKPGTIIKGLVWDEIRKAKQKREEIDFRGGFCDSFFWRCHTYLIQCPGLVE